MTNISALKNRSKKSLDRLTEQVEKMKAPASAKAEDDRFWKPTVDQSGNGSATIRFLPEPSVDGDDALPWVRVFTHGFKGPSGSWYIENSLTTIGQQDPVSEYNTKLWNSGVESDKDIARDQKRRLGYISNIEVIDDPAAPENNGKTFLYRYGVKIFDKLNEAMHPEFEDETAFNPFDPWDGADFKLRIRQVAGYRNYDKSGFADPKPMERTDEEIEKLWNSLYSLKDFHDPKHFKSYDELLGSLNRVVGFDTQGGVSEESESAPAPKSKRPSAPAKAETEDAPFDIDSTSSDDDDEILKEFQRLADAD